jgi:hypothetical protein
MITPRSDFDRLPVHILRLQPLNTSPKWYLRELGFALRPLLVELPALQPLNHGYEPDFPQRRFYIKHHRAELRSSRPGLCLRRRRLHARPTHLPDETETFTRHRLTFHQPPGHLAVP